MYTTMQRAALAAMLLLGSAGAMAAPATVTFLPSRNSFPTYRARPGTANACSSC
ncbi:hypothetical protein LP420_15575 [Massilia sp. B-10]|nr:hypothetical protein LP420_15575 [Massilia sp. B-10]